MAVFVVGARWMYAETALVVPAALPMIDSALERMAIPTHDQWSEQFQSAQEFALAFSKEHPDLFKQLSKVTHTAHLTNASSHSNSSSSSSLNDIQRVLSSGGSLMNASLKLDRTGS